MMGHQHALGGAATWLAAAPLLPLTPGQTVLGVVLAAGGGMVPDLDQAGSTVARTFGPVTWVLAKITAAVSGGHRNGTHSVPGLAVTGVLLGVAAWLVPWVAVWVVLGIGVRGLRKGRHKWTAAVTLAAACGGVTWLVRASGMDPTVPLVVGGVLGAVSHVGLDMLTPQRCPLWWPFSKRRYGVGLVTTGSPRTSGAVTGVLTVAVGVAGYLSVLAA